MIAGVLAGVFWALETVILGIALAMSPFCSNEQAVFLAPFVSTFLHDLCSAIWATLLNGFRGKLGDVWNALCSGGGKWIVLAAVIGGPVGMTGYVLTVNYMGAPIGAIASAVFPAIGSVLACIFLKEKMKWYQWGFLLLTLLGVYGLSHSADMSITNFWLGLLGALMCSFGWGIEAVVLAKCFRDTRIANAYALQIRQSTSALVYGLILLPVLKGWGFTVSLFTEASGWLIPTIALAALCATVSYLCYYRAISRIGASKAMALNVTYAAWAIVFTVLLLRDVSVLTPLTVGCAAIVLICGIFAATDLKALFAGRKE